MKQILKTKQEVIDYIKDHVLYNKDWEITYLEEFSGNNWAGLITSAKKTNIIYGGILHILEKAGFDICSIEFKDEKVIICFTN